MDLSHPINALSPGLTGAVLEVLCRTTRPLSGRAVQRLLPKPASQAGVQKTLDRLATAGLVTQTAAGRSILNLLNRDHALAPAVVEAVAVGDEIPARIAEVVKTYAKGVSRALLFGSVARGEAGPGSDIDLLLVWPAGTDSAVRWSATAAVAIGVARLTGNPCTPLVYTDAEYAGLPERAPGFAESLAREAVTLIPAA
ncbi:nucleotidyltransferase domain-containing protein [Candidatus Spongiisocius sp.]|uniref:nucleotidyltransferase domain-containing protein n=1 Tax=Candidatus Spongiisocius sp. TaxID=3101273 RepID=UPI003B5BC717